MEEFFRAVGKSRGLPGREQVVNKTYTEEQVKAANLLFEAHGMDLLGPPHILEARTGSAQAGSNGSLTRVRSEATLSHSHAELLFLPPKESTLRLLLALFNF